LAPLEGDITVGNCFWPVVGSEQGPLPTPFLMAFLEYLDVDVSGGVPEDFETKFREILEDTSMEVNLIRIFDNQLCVHRKLFMYGVYGFHSVGFGKSVLEFNNSWGLNASYYNRRWRSWTPQTPAQIQTKKFLTEVLSSRRYPLRISLPADSDMNFGDSGVGQLMADALDPLNVKCHFGIRVAILIERYFPLPRH